MRVLVLGARGMLGTDLLSEWQSDELVPAGSAEADLRDSSQVNALVKKVLPNWIVLSAAYTDVDGCEKNPELAFAVNATGAKNVSTVMALAHTKPRTPSSPSTLMALRRPQANRPSKRTIPTGALVAPLGSLAFMVRRSRRKFSTPLRLARSFP